MEYTLSISLGNGQDCRSIFLTGSDKEEDQQDLVSESTTRLGRSHQEVATESKPPCYLPGWIWRKKLRTPYLMAT